MTGDNTPWGLLKAAAFPVLGAAAVVVATLVPPASGDDAARRPTSVPVTQTTYACPAGSVITVAAGQVAAGATSSARALPSGAGVDALDDPRSWRTGVVDGEGTLVDQRGAGSGAVGYFAGTAPKAGGGGLVVGACAGIVDEAWLLGLGSGNQHFSTLILTNLGSSTAAVDVTLWGADGPVDAVDADGIVIEPGAVRRIRLDTLAAGEAELAVHLERRRGSVSAVVNDTSTATFRGTEPVSPAPSPRRDQVVGGLPGGSATSTLLLLNPGTSTARVRVEVVGKDGTFAPSGLDEVTVRGGTVGSFTVPASVGSDPAALRLTSDQPVSATVRVAPSTNDYAYAEAAVPLTGPAVVPVALGPSSAPPRLVLTAPGRAATVEVEAFDAGMTPLGSSRVEVAAGTTLETVPDVDGAAYLVLRPTGDVVAAATYVRGDAVSSLALTSAPVSVKAPQVRPAR